MLDAEPFQNVKVVFLDLDDTLCGYWDAAKAGLRETFETVPIEGFSTDEMISTWAAAFRDFAPSLKKTGWYETYLKEGEPTRTEQMRLTLESIGIQDLAKSRELSQAYMEARNRNFKLFPESLEVLEALFLKHPLGLLTNGPADIQRQEIATVGIEKYFKWICIEGEMGRGKPIPAVFEYCEQLAGVKPGEMLMVGNSYAHDVLPALHAGWKGVWVRRPSDVAPSSAGQEEKPSGAPEPTATITSLLELLGG